MENHDDSVLIKSRIRPFSFVIRNKEPNENQDFVEEKFKELDSDQIEGGEFEFLGPKIRFERNREI